MELGLKLDIRVSPRTAKLRLTVNETNAGLLAAGSQAKMLPVYAATDGFRPQSRRCIRPRNKFGKGRSRDEDFSTRKETAFGP